MTANVYLRRLGSFCEYFNTSSKLTSCLGENGSYNKLFNYVFFLEEKDRAGSYIEAALKAVKSWLARDGIEIRRGIKIRGCS